MVEILDFSAEWCGPCEQQKSILKELEDDYGDVEFSYIDIEDEMETANKYGVQAVPTLVVLDDEGGVHAQMVGLQQKDTLTEHIHNLT